MNKRFIELAMLFVVAVIVSAMATGSHAADGRATASSLTTTTAQAFHGPT